MKSLVILFVLSLASCSNAPGQDVRIGPVYPGTPVMGGGTMEFGGPGFFYKGNIYRSHVSAQRAELTDFINGRSPAVGSSYGSSYRRQYRRPSRYPRRSYRGYKSIYSGYVSPFLR